MAVLEQLRRGFDFVCTVAGLAALILLGPWILSIALSMRIPDVRELVPLEGTLVTCRETIGDATLVLAGRDTPFSAQGGSCADVLSASPRPVRVRVFVAAAELNAHPAAASVASFGLSVNGKMIRERQSDLQASRIDQVLGLGIGLTATLALAWLAFMVVRTKRRLARLFLGGKP